MGNSLPIWSELSMNTRIVIGTITGGITLIILFRRLRSKSRSIIYPKDTVILHQIGRGPWAPSMTPFAVKLETYLRMANIPYQNVHRRQNSSKGKVPWMEYNGEVVADSQFCIEYLNKKLDVNLNKALTPEQQAIGRAFLKMVEENTYWTYVLFRWYHDEDMRALSAFGTQWYRRWYVRPLFRKKVKSLADAQGIGRHSKEELHSVMMDDLQAVSSFLGKNKFLFGDKPCEVDCGLFGQLAQMYWHSFDNPPVTAIKKFPNLCDYCERMKDTFWPDWNNCITYGGTRIATK